VYWITLVVISHMIPQMTVAPFRYSAFAFMFAGLVNIRIQSRHCNDFTLTFIMIDIATHLNKKTRGRFVSNTLYGSHDVYVLFPVK